MYYAPKAHVRAEPIKIDNPKQTVSQQHAPPPPKETAALPRRPPQRIPPYLTHAPSTSRPHEGPSPATDCTSKQKGDKKEPQKRVAEQVPAVARR
ncbi:hypothetical protein NDU88_002775 [Pleurodeles waltl]|uniref:Uncharacterized protein n=1 Tax=Pleurodeles waltl TaxID=8319 RepID=A0AAV7PAZ7_PLEWA|nr:hypothetical protein NDU88_002775 [Pleurodeles waltl]